MKIELRPIEAIKPYPGNPRVNDGAVDAAARCGHHVGGVAGWPGVGAGDPSSGGVGGRLLGVARRDVDERVHVDEREILALLLGEARRLGNAGHADVDLIKGSSKEPP